MDERQSRIDRLIDADATNVRVSAHLLRNLHPWTYDGIRHTEQMFRSLVQRLQDWSAMNRLRTELNQMAVDAGLSSDELAKRLAEGDSGINAAAVETYSRFGALQIVRIVVLACQRYWAWGVTDLLRMRSSSASGYLRLEAESVALAEIFVRLPSIRRSGRSRSPASSYSPCWCAS